MTNAKPLTIKFSHSYNKLPVNQNKALLLEVFIKNREDMSESFLFYDTVYVETNVEEFYQLPETGSMIVLLFKSGTQIFTTIRPYNFFKYNWYLKNRNNEFMIEMTK